ncbi:MAG TPA: DegV family protein [Candidatus Dormibacteraeota bacterium]
MSSVAIVTDSTADLPADLARERGVTVVPLTVSLQGTDYLDGVDITAADFYRRLQAGAGAVATTSQPAPARFQEAYHRLLEKHDEVVSIHISEKLSGTYAAAVQGAELAGAGKRVRVVDSAMVSMPLGLMVLAASGAASGGSAREVVERLEELRAQVGVFFMVATLEYLRRGGRIGAANALLGSVLQVKPVLTIREGEVTPLERVRTQERALARLVDLVREQDRGHGLCAIVGHAASEATAERIASDIEDGCESLLVQPLGPVVGAHAGPGTVGVGCYPAELFPLRLKRLSAAAAR